MLQQRTDLDRALERLFKNGYPYWRTIRELRQAEDPQALLKTWRSAKKPSQAWRSCVFFREAVGILAVAMGVSREEVEERVWQHITEDR